MIYDFSILQNDDKVWDNICDNREHNFSGRENKKKENEQKKQRGNLVRIKKKKKKTGLSL